MLAVEAQVPLANGWFRYYPTTATAARQRTGITVGELKEPTIQHAAISALLATMYQYACNVAKCVRITSDWELPI